MVETIHVFRVLLTILETRLQTKKRKKYSQEIVEGNPIKLKIGLRTQTETKKKPTTSNPYFLIITLNTNYLTSKVKRYRRVEGIKNKIYLSFHLRKYLPLKDKQHLNMKGQNFLKNK